jgi:hypothetical protein
MTPMSRGPVVDGRHVDEREAVDVISAEVGEGTPRSAPWVIPDAAKGARFSWQAVAGVVLAQAGTSVALLAADMTTAGVLLAASSFLTGVGGALVKA